ncbi:MAG: hypothetical protein ACKV2O_15290 [Acidimicrobiales bacterium]
MRSFVAEWLVDGRANIVAALTYELPALMLFKIMGIPAADLDQIKGGSLSRLRFMFGRCSEEEQVDAAVGMAAFWRYCEELANDRRAHPRDDFTTDLVHTADESGTPLASRRSPPYCSVRCWPATKPPPTC